MNFDRLRALLFQQAMRGQLVPQFDEEKSVNIMPIVTSDVPHELPRKWVWVRSDEILEFIRGVTFPASAKRSALSEGIVRCLTTGSVQKRHNLAADVFVPSTYVKKDRQYLKKNDVVISSANSKELVGKSIIWKGGEPRVSFGGFLTVARVKKDEINPIFVYYFFQFLFESRYFANLSTQTTNIANLSNALLSSVLFPLPPIEEQERIVAKLEEAFAEIDRAEKAYEELQTLAGVLRGQILQEAIQGKLVPQMAEEGVVEQIGVAPDERPFEIPKSWKWRALDEIFKFVYYRGKTPTKTTDGVRLITASNVRQGYVDHKRIEFISSEEYIDRQNRGISKKGDILFTTEAPLGNVALADLDVYSAGQRVITLQTDSENKKLLMYFMLSPYFQKALKNNATGTTAQGIKAARLKKLMLPVPPVEEQARIASKVEELLKQVDALSA